MTRPPNEAAIRDALGPRAARDFARFSAETRALFDAFRRADHARAAPGVLASAPRGPSRPRNPAMAVPGRSLDACCKRACPTRICASSSGATPPMSAATPAGPGRSGAGLAGRSGGRLGGARRHGAAGAGPGRAVRTLGRHAAPEHARGAHSTDKGRVPRACTWPMAPACARARSSSTATRRRCLACWTSRQAPQNAARPTRAACRRASGPLPPKSRPWAGPRRAGLSHAVLRR